MEHYACSGGCAGVSDKPQNCGASDCSNYGKPMEKCECGDDMHGQTSEGDVGEDEM